jgi:myo-inositol-1(or 4)-monophosphatase
MDHRTFLEQELKKAAELARQHFGKVSGTVKTGDNNQVLTEADIAIGKQLVAAIGREFPDHNIIDEEAGVIDKKSRFTWVVDPIDGTSNFAVGLPHYGIMVGLLDGATPIAGGIVSPAFDYLCVAEKGKGTTCNGKPVHVTDEQNLLNALVAYCIDGHQENPELTIQECQTLARIILGIRNLRTTGCDGFDTPMLVMGRYGGALNRTSKIWDNVAPHIIVEEASGIFTDFEGNPMDYTNPLTKVDQNFTHCAASPKLHKQLQAIIHEGAR